MANAIDYLDWRGDVPLDFDGFNEVDGYIVCKLTSLDFTGIVPQEGSMPLRDALEAYFERYGDEDRRLGVLLAPGSVTMVKKMPKKKRALLIMLCSCAAMLSINIFSWNFSSISLILIAAAISLAIFMIQNSPLQKGGASK